jgi:hypothetical protein
VAVTEQLDLRAVVGGLFENPAAALSGLLEQVAVSLLGDDDDTRALTAKVLGAFTGPTEDDPAYDVLLERSMLLAAALGACDCWGEDPACPVCSGAGLAGWRPPDPAAFDVFVAPALEAMKGE